MDKLLTNIVKHFIQIYDDDMPLGNPIYHRYILSPGDNLEDQPEILVKLAKILWN